MIETRRLKNVVIFIQTKSKSKSEKANRYSEKVKKVVFGPFDLIYCNYMTSSQNMAATVPQKKQYERMVGDVFIEPPRESGDPIMTCFCRKNCTPILEIAEVLH